MRNKLLGFTFLSIAILFMNGCSAKGPQFNGFKKPINGNANVYLYRTSYLGAAVIPDIHIIDLSNNKDKILGTIKPNGYIMTTIKPGKYKFWARTEAKNEVQIEAYSNKIYCIENYISIGFVVGHPQFRFVDMEECKKDIKETKLSISKKE